MEKERYREEKIGISEGGAKSAPGRDVSIQASAGADVELFISDTTLNNMFEKTDEELAAGTFIGSVYEVVSSLGSGGMSHIYLCRDIGLNRMVAVKLLRSANAGKQAIMRLQTEGRAVARLKHPNIVNLFGLQLTESGQPFLVMEVVNGISLAALLKTQGPLPVFKLLKYINQICEALEHAHKNGVIHRDLKPSNIMVVNAGSQNEQIKILDFGIAKVLNDDAGQINATQTGEIFGTPGYMSPEQAKGKRIDERSDQYSLGCVIFELLTGVPPFKRDSQLAVLMAHAQEKPPSLSQASGKQFSAELEAAIARMLAKDPADRFATIDDAGKAIAGMFAAEGGWRRYLVPAAAVAAALILSAASIGFVLQQPKPLVREPAAATEIGLPSNNFSQPVKEGKPEDASTADFSLLMDLKAGRLRDIVNLPDAEITNRGLQYMSEFPDAHIRVLSLKNCLGITDDGLAYLQKLNDLTTLNLDTASVTDRGLEIIAHIKTLKVLSVRNNSSIGDAGVRCLAKLPQLENLDVCNTVISGSAFSHFRHLKVLNVDQTEIQPHLKDLLSVRPETLYIDDCGLKDSDMDTIVRLKNLETLALEKNHELSNAGLAKLAHLPKLKILSLRKTAVTRQQAEAFAQMMKGKGQPLTLYY